MLEFFKFSSGKSNEIRFEYNKNKPTCSKAVSRENSIFSTYLKDVWENILKDNILSIVKERIDENTDLICSSMSEAFVFDGDNCGAGCGMLLKGDSDFSRCMTSSVILDNLDLTCSSSCQVVLVDEKISNNAIFGQLMILKSLDLTVVYTSDKVEAKRITSFDFLLKTEKLGCDLVSLLASHRNAAILDESVRKGSVKDRRLLSVEQLANCTFTFPHNLRVFRYKTVRCVKIRLLSKSESLNVMALNLLKNKIPKLYNECIFTKQINDSTASAFSYSSIISPVRRANLIQRPFPLFSNKK